MAEGPTPENLTLPPPPPGTPEPEDVVATYKRVFFRGLSTLLPTILTLYVVVAVYQFVDGKIAQPITELLKTELKTTEGGNRAAVAIFDLRPRLAKRVPQDGSEAARTQEEDREAELAIEIDKRFPSWVGFVFAIVAVFIVGFFIASFVGRWLWKLVEASLMRIPLVKSVYPGAKQMVEFFVKSDEKKKSYSTVVAVEYPRKGVWAIGYITGPGMKPIEERQGDTMHTIFLPATPTMAGYVVHLAEREVVQLDMTVDEAAKFIVSGGVVRPVRTKPLDKAPLPAAPA